MNRQGNIGTGIALCGDSNVNDGYRSVERNYPSSYGLTSAMTLPTEISVATMEDWKEFLSSNEILKADESNDPYSWTIYYKMEEGQIQSLSDSSSNDPFVTFRDGFTQLDDLSLWWNVSLFLKIRRFFRNTAGLSPFREPKLW